MSAILWVADPFYYNKIRLNVSYIEQALTSLGFLRGRDFAVKHGLKRILAAWKFVSIQRNLNWKGASVRWLIREGEGRTLKEFSRRQILGFVARYARHLTEDDKQILTGWALQSANADDGPRYRSPGSKAERWQYEELEKAYGKSAVKQGRKRVGNDYYLWMRAVRNFQQAEVKPVTLKEILLEAQAELQLDSEVREAMLRRPTEEEVEAEGAALFRALQERAQERERERAAEQAIRDKEDEERLRAQGNMYSPGELVLIARAEEERAQKLVALKERLLRQSRVP